MILLCDPKQAIATLFIDWRFWLCTSNYKRDKLSYRNWNGMHALGQTIRCRDEQCAFPRPSDQSIGFPDMKFINFYPLRLFVARLKHPALSKWTLSLLSLLLIAFERLERCSRLSIQERPLQRGTTWSRTRAHFNLKTRRETKLFHSDFITNSTLCGAH